MVLKNIGITGAAGLVGSHLIPMLSKYNYEIIGTSRKKISKNNSNLSYKSLDLLKSLNQKKINKIFSNIDCLIHLAAMLPSNNKIKNVQLKKINYTNTKKLIDWAHKKKIFFIFFSSLSIFSKKHIPYSIYKKKIEKYMIEKKGLKFLILRPSSIYGFGQKDKTFLLNNINKIKNKELMYFYRPLSIKFNFIHASDIARAIIFLMNKNTYGTYNIKNEKNTTLKELIILFKKVFNIEKEKFIIKNEVNYSNNINNIIKANFKKITKMGWKTQIKLYDGLLQSFVKNKIII